jgi:adenylate kinase family enzyme
MLRLASASLRPAGRRLAVLQQPSRRALCQGAATAQQKVINVSVEEPPADNNEPDAEEVAMRPKEIVAQLDRFIVGQSEAKRAVAVAMRNRWRRQRVGSPLKEDIMPKNILMIGPTGVGKTEIARRLAKLARAPFLKVEATKFTEVGFVGKDVEQIIRDLMDVGITMAKARAVEQIKEKVSAAVEEKLLDCLVGPSNIQHNREAFRKLLRMGHLDDRLIEIEASAAAASLPARATQRVPARPHDAHVAHRRRLARRAACPRRCPRRSRRGRRSTAAATSSR